jgi:hypothetical protein
MPTVKHTDRGLLINIFTLVLINYKMLVKENFFAETQMLLILGSHLFVALRETKSNYMCCKTFFRQCYLKGYKMIKTQNKIRILCLLICLLVAVNAQIYSEDQPENKLKKITSIHDPDIFSLLFPIRNQIYPNSEQKRTINQPPPQKDQYLHRSKITQKLIEDAASKFSKDVFQKDLASVVFLPLAKGTFRYHATKLFQSPESDQFWQYLISFSYDHVYVTAVYTGRAFAVTFEYEEDRDAPESLEAVTQNLSRFLPLMSGMDFRYDLPENQEIYKGNDFDETNLYQVKATREKKYAQEWLNFVRWWRGYGRFGISFENLPHDYYEQEDQPQYDYTNPYFKFEN